MFRNIKPKNLIWPIVELRQTKSKLWPCFMKMISKMPSSTQKRDAKLFRKLIQQNCYITKYLNKISPYNGKELQKERFPRTQFELPWPFCELFSNIQVGCQELRERRLLTHIQVYRQYSQLFAAKPISKGSMTRQNAVQVSKDSISQSLATRAKQKNKTVNGYL